MHLELSAFERNANALSSNSPQLREALSAASRSETVSVVSSRSGHPVPTDRVGVRTVAFHSLFDPIREAERLTSVHFPGDFVVFLGLGAGYHIRPFLKADTLSGVLVIDRDTAVYRAVLEKIDLSDILGDPRVSVLLDEDPQAIRQFLLDNYLPGIDGGLQTVTLRNRFDLEERYFRSILHGIQDAASAIRDDYSVQAHFGKRWFGNAVSNLAAAQNCKAAINPAEEVLITGAGPSLETQTADIRCLMKNAVLIASDTSLPSLLSVDIVPDIVLSIDCQQITYHHFLRGLPRTVTLVLDLSSPPTVARITDRTVFFSSGHPFSAYTSARCRPLPYLDVSGGNVSYAAISLAECLGARRIHLFGLDFSYPDGMPYARETYIHDLFRVRETRFSPTSNAFYSFVHAAGAATPLRVGQRTIHTTKLLLTYREKMGQSLGRIGAQIIHHSGKGLDLAPQVAPSRPQHRSASRFSQGTEIRTWRGFLTDYLVDLMRLPPPTVPLRKYLSELRPDQRHLWITQYPIAAALRGTTGSLQGCAASDLHNAREWAAEKISAVLTAEAP